MTQVQRLAEAFRARPELLAEVLVELGILFRGRQEVNSETKVFSDLIEDLARVGVHICEYPGCRRVDVAATPSMTAYTWDPALGETDPNRDLWLCPEHAQEHTEEMEERWKEYHNEIRAGLGSAFR